MHSIVVIVFPLLYTFSILWFFTTRFFMTVYITHDLTSKHNDILFTRAYDYIYLSNKDNSKMMTSSGRGQCCIPTAIHYIQ